MSSYLLPARTSNAETGKTRRVGFEIEFAGLELDTVSTLVADTLNGEIEKLTEAECKIHVDGLDPFIIELDWQFAKALARERLEKHEDVDDPLVSWLTSAASQVVPVEIVCPPIPMDRLDLLDPVISALRQSGARGTFASPVYAFGVHINTELPDLKQETVVNYLRAFAICQEWLVRAHGVDLARRITPYIDMYPFEYNEQLLLVQPESADAMIKQYLEHNPTRNRALDMTPLFKHLNEALLLSTLDDDRINARPTFHYRLPNSTPEEAGWSLADTWHPWCVVEHLAEDAKLLQTLSADWHRYFGDPLNRLSIEDPPWFDRLDVLYEALTSSAAN